MTVGRSRDVDVRLSDDHVSRVHAEVEPRRGWLFVRDVGSRHGTFVNGERVSETSTLADDGSVVRFGDTLLMAVDDLARHGCPPRRLQGVSVGMAHDMLAGPTLSEVWDQATRVAELRDPVLILGESGSGKECVARLIHHVGTKAGPFVGINIAAIPKSLFEAELFGHERGAFTGAAVARSGAFRDASGGVLFLDEVGDLTEDLQVKLLRAIDLKCVRPLGSCRDFPIAARLVTATSRDLREACRAGRFRTDLYYRLAGIIIRVPPLRTRREDIILHALSFLREQSSSLRLSANAAETLVLASWEGNIRNLRYAVTHAVGRAAETGCHEVLVEHLPDLRPIHETSTELTEEKIRWAMKESGGIAAQAAAALGISRTTLYNSLKRLKIELPSLRVRIRKTSEP